MSQTARLDHWLPCLRWLKHYNRSLAGQDSLAAAIVTLMLIPQSLAYAMLAGLPPVTGLYASILPLVAYALFGTSNTLAIGPVAIVSLMTAAALGPLFSAGTPEYVAAALLLALLSGIVLLVMALLRLGFIANFLSHPVITGFISASGILIAIGQLPHILGIEASGQSAAELLIPLLQGLPSLHWPTLVVGSGSLLLLYLARFQLQNWLVRAGCNKTLAGHLSRTGPVLTLLLAILVVTLFDLAQAGVAVVGSVPSGVPLPTLPALNPGLAVQLLPAAILISLVGFVESVSVGQTLAAKRRERIEPNQELVGLGAANIAASLNGGFPVTGGFARSVVNYDAGARTPMAGAFTAIGIAVTVMLFTPLFHNLPQAVLAATIIMAVLSLVDLGALSRTGPVLTLLLAILVVTLFDLAQAGVAVVGSVPSGVPLLTLPTLDPGLAVQLLPAAILISLVGFVESVSVGQTLAAKRRERIEPNQELVGLGAANIAASLNGGFPVTGGFARSVVNYDAGARTPMAGAFTAIGIAMTVMLFTPLFHNLPQAVLAATIIIAVLSLVDLGALSRTWRYSRPDAMAMAVTMAGVLLAGVEAGILMGVGLSLFLFLKRTSEPHIAVVGQLPGSQHFRNVDRFQVIKSATVLSVRVDESLYFPNARYLEDRIAELAAHHPGIHHLVLMCPAVNLIDASALESLETISERLRDAGIQLHLSEVKGPVMDQLQQSHFLTSFGGQVFVSHYEALLTLDPDTTLQALDLQALDLQAPDVHQPAPSETGLRGPDH